MLRTGQVPEERPVDTSEQMTIRAYRLTTFGPQIIDRTKLVFHSDPIYNGFNQFYMMKMIIHKKAPHGSDSETFSNDKDEKDAETMEQAVQG